MSKRFTQANRQLAVLACVSISMAISASWNASRASAQGSTPASNSEITIIDVAATLRAQRGARLHAFLYAPVELEALLLDGKNQDV